MKALLILAMFTALAGCAVSNDPENQNTAQIRQNKLVEDLYGPLVGTYAGKVTHTNHGDEDVQLVIYITSEAATNPDGTPGTRKVPRAFFRRIKPIVQDYSLSATGYRPEIGELSLGNDGKGLDLKSIEGTVAGKHISGEVQLFSATLGQLDVDWISKSTSAPDDLGDRLLKAFQSVAGDYTGTIISADKTKKPVPVVISLIAIMAGGTPAMIGFYRRPDVPSGVIDLPLTVTYTPNSNPPDIDMHGKGGGKYEIDINGTLIKGTIDTSFNSLFEGYLGRLVAKRTSSPSPTPHPPPPP